MIKKIVTALKSATSLKVYPFYTDELKECIVYEWTPRSDNGSMQSAQLMIRIKSKDMATAESNAGKVKSALLVKGDGSAIRGLTACEQNGGGCLRDYDTGFVDYIMYFDLVFKS